MTETIAVLVPCYNEAMTIGKVVDDFRETLPEATVYVYDNNSSDETASVARAHGAVVRFEPRQGKGNVVRQMLRDIDADYYLMVDGDDTYPADAARSLLEPLLNGSADHVVGDRLSNGSYGEENKRAFHGLGNELVRRLIKILPEEAEATAQMFDVLLGDNLSGRKDFIAVNGAKYLDLLDIS